MEPDVSIVSSSMIRVAVIPIGPVPSPCLREYYSMLLRQHTVPLSGINAFYTEHQKSPFSHQPWDSGSIRFKFIFGGEAPSAWEDFQSQRKTLAVIGISHCPSSPDLDSVVYQFDNVCKMYSSSLVGRCFAFSPGDSQLVDGGKREGNLRLFPPADHRTLELHLQTMIQEIAASLLMEFEKWVLQAESSGTVLKTPLDFQASFSSEEFIKAKKRRLGRLQKTIGDYCLLAGSPVDANAHFSTALELARLTADYFWYAGALEGSVCALVIDTTAPKDPGLNDEVRYRYNSIITNYRKSVQDNNQRVSPLSFELEATLKLARFLCRRELSKEVLELLTTAADGAKSLIDASDRLVLYVEIARLFDAIGYQRKAAFFSRQVAQLYLQQENSMAAISALQVLVMTTKAYRVQSRASISESKQRESASADTGKMYQQSAVSLFASQWSTLQMVTLREILLSAVRSGDPLAAWSAAARLLRSHYPLINPAGQNGLANALSSSADRLPSGTRSADPALPFIRLYSFPVLPSQMDIVKRNPAREDWWLGSASSGPFIYTPFSKGEPNNVRKQELIWVVGEPIQVLVELANPCCFDLRVDSIYLSVRSANFDAFPISVELPPNSSKVITLSGKPTSVGQVKVPGCIVHCFGVITEHLFKDVDNLLLGVAQGLVISDPFRCCGSPKLKNVSIPNISVAPQLPLLVPHIVGGDGAIILHEGEICDVWICLANAGTVPVECAHISLSGKNQDSVLSFANETLQSALPLKPGTEVTLPVTLKAWELGPLDPDSAAGKSASGGNMKHSKDGNCPSLLIHYAGPLKTSQESGIDGHSVPPGRRVVVPLQICVLQGLSFVKARLLSMEFPAHVSEHLPKPVQRETNSAEEPFASERTMDRLVKMDPFRGSWGLRFLEIELSNPTDVVFEICVSVQLDNSGNEDNVSFEEEAAEYGCPRTIIDRDCSARVLVPLEHFKLPVLDASFFTKDYVEDTDGGKTSSFSDKNMKAELNACVRNIVSKIKIRWYSGQNISGELNVRDAMQAALQTSIMDVLLPDPLTFGFRLVRNSFDTEKESDLHIESSASKDSVIAYDMTPMEVLVRNNTRDMIQLSLSIGCRDVAGESCVDGSKATVLWNGVLNRIAMEVPPLQETKHSFSLYFLVPGDYTLVAVAVIHDTNDILRARARTTSPDEPIFWRGPPYHVSVVGNV